MLMPKEENFAQERIYLETMSYVQTQKKKKRKKIPA